MFILCWNDFVLREYICLLVIYSLSSRTDRTPLNIGVLTFFCIFIYIPVYLYKSFLFQRK